MNNTKKWEYLVCCESGNMDLLKEIDSAYPNGIPSDIKQEGLEIASTCGNTEIVKYILKNMDSGDLDKETCIRLATKKAHMQTVTALISDSFKHNKNM